MEFPDIKLKRKRSISLDRNTVHRLNKRRLRFGTISIPVNDEYGYDYALVTYHVYPLPPNESLKFAVENGLLNRVVYGTAWNSVIEGLIVDEETGIPWQVPKVVIGYRRVDYSSSVQPYTEQSARYEEPPVSPKTIGDAGSSDSFEGLDIC